MFHAKMHKSTKSACKKILHPKHPFGNATVDLQCWLRISTNENFVGQRPSRWPLKILIDYNCRSSHGFGQVYRSYRCLEMPERNAPNRPGNEESSVAQVTPRKPIQSLKIFVSEARNPQTLLVTLPGKLGPGQRPQCPALIKGILEGKLQLWKGRRATINGLSMWSSIGATTRETAAKGKIAILKWKKRCSGKIVKQITNMASPNCSRRYTPEGVTPVIIAACCIAVISGFGEPPF